MKRFSKANIFIAIVLSVLLVCPFGCKKEEPQTKEIKIGAILPLTGEAAPYGTAARQAIDMAIAEINSDDTDLKSMVRVIYEDSKLDPKTATSAATKLCTVDKVRAIIGPMASTTVEAILPITQKHKAIVISPAATAHNLSGREGFFRTIVSDVYDGTAMAEFAYRELGFRRIPVLYIEAAGPSGVAQSFIQRFKQLGGEIPLTETGAPNDTDFRAQLTKIKASMPTALYFAAYAVESATILIQAKELGLQTQMLSHQLVEDPEVRERARDAANGVIYTTPKLDPATGGPAVRAFYKRFVDKFGEEPRNFASNSYDALRLLVNAIRDHGYTYEGIRAGLLSTQNYAGASGTLSFDENGDVLQKMRVMMIQGGQPVEYAPK